MRRHRKRRVSLSSEQSGFIAVSLLVEIVAAVVAGVILYVLKLT